MGQSSEEKANMNNPVGTTKVELNAELQRSWESLPNIGSLHFYRIFFTLAALINCLQDPPQERRRWH